MPIAFENPPELPPTAFWSLVGLVVLIWLFARVQLLRRQRARGAERTTRLRFLHTLADWRGTPAALLVLAAGLLALFLLSL